MKALRILIVICLIGFRFSAFGAENRKGEVLAVLRTPAGMTLSKESLKSGKVRKFIDLTAESVGAKVVSVYESLSLANKDGNIFVFMVSDSKSSEQLAADLKSDPNVLSASPNRKVELVRPVK